MVEAIVTEIEMREAYLGLEPEIETIYFGGGTPSLLSQSDLEQIFETIYKIFVVSEKAEITLEANPDDLGIEKLKELSETPINRLSIGIQSFFDEDLKFMNRAHNAEEAKNCIKAAQYSGFENLTIDLIYGSPTTSDRNWESNLKTTFELNIPHISCYCLTVEPQTALAHFVKTGKAQPVNEEHASPPI